MRVLVAPDRFGSTLPATRAAAAIRDGWARAAPSDDVRVLPLSDGGPGLLAALQATAGGELLSVTVRSPWGDDVPAAVLLVTDDRGGRTAYVESTHATGRHLLPDHTGEPQADAASSAGVGQLLELARETGARRVVVGLGPASTHDAGAGMLAALGVGDGLRGRLGDGVRGLADVDAHDLRGLRELRGLWAATDLVVAVDTDLPLLGLHGASASAAARGELPGDRAQAIERSVAHLAHLAVAALGPDAARRDLLAAATPARAVSLPGAGAGGGLGFALTLLGGRLLPGPAVVADAVDLTGRLAGVDAVVTGTADLDPLALHGSVVTTVADAALAAAVPTVVLADQVLVGRRELAAAGIAAAYPVRDTPDDDTRGSLDPADALARRAERVARTWSR